MQHIFRLGARAALCVLLLLGLIPGIASAEYILSAPPRETPEAGAALYGPLAEHLTALLGAKVTYQHPGNWAKYEKNIKNGEYDIIFDGPHFVAWRIESQDVKPLVKLPGELRFVLLTHNSHANIKQVEDLVSKRICTMPSPNLGTLKLYSMYPNPVQQPDFVLVKGGTQKVIENFNAGKCEGMVLPSFVYNNGLLPQMRAGLRIIKESPPIANQGITVSTRLSEREQELMRTSLTTGAGQKAAQPVLARFSGKGAKLQPATIKDYEGYNLLHDNMIFGW